MSRLIKTLLLLTVVLIYVPGCSRDSVVQAPDTGDGLAQTSIGEPIRYPMGLYTFICEPEKGSIEIIEIRDAALHLNALTFLEPPPNLHLALASQPVFSGGIVDVDIALTNPYLALTQYTGFDVCGVVITSGSQMIFNDPELIMAGEGETRLLNADGYTRWWNPVEFPYGNGAFNYKDGMLGTPDSVANFTATVNGYKYFADGLGKNDTLDVLDLADRGVFRAGQQLIRHYKLSLGGGLVFNYAVDACWKFPTGDPPYDVPGDFPPAANRPEAWNIRVNEIENTLHYVDDTYFVGGTLKVSIDVFDHFSPELNQVSAYSTAGLPLDEALTPSGGGEGYASYELEFDGASLQNAGNQDLLVLVRSNVSNYGGMLPGKPVDAFFKYVYNISDQPPDYWTLTWGGGGVHNKGRANDVQLDSEGNIFVLGVNAADVDFDPGPGVDILDSQNEYVLFLSKFNAHAVHQWTRIWLGGEGKFPEILVDEEDNIYICSEFFGIIDLDPGFGVDEVLTHGEQDCFLVKLNNSGEYIWGKIWGGGLKDEATGMVKDSLGNIYISGGFRSATDFDPGPDVDVIEPNGTYNTFISKFNKFGEHLWARVFLTTDDGPDQGFYNGSYAVDAGEFGSVYVGGYFSDSTDFDPGPGIVEKTATGGSLDAYLCKLTSDGDFNWVLTWGGLDWDNTLGIAADNAGSVYVTGYFNGTVDLYPGPGVDEHESWELMDALFVSKFTNQGNFLWADSWIYGRGSDINYSPDAQIYVVGDENIEFIRKYNPESPLLWSFNTNYPGNKRICNGITTDEYGGVFIAGGFEGPVADMNLGTGIDLHSSTGGMDAFLTRLPSSGF